MISEQQLLAHCEKLQLPPLGVQYVKRVANSGPSRRVQSNGINVTVRFPSKKMSCVIQAESHKVELALIHVLENDPAVLFYWDQPESFRISYCSNSGRPATFSTTPDFLVVRSDRIGWIEAKPLEALPELAKKMPRRYVMGEDKVWRSPPAEAAAKAFGFSFHIWTPGEVSSVWLGNIDYLADYFGAPLDEAKEVLYKQIKAKVQKEQGLTINDLRVKCADASADDLNLLIAKGDLHVDLEAALLTDPKRVRIFSCREAAETLALLSKRIRENCSLELSGRELPRHVPDLPNEYDDVGDKQGTASDSTKNPALGPPDGNCLSQLQPDASALFRRASPEDLAIANRRYRILTDPEFAKLNPVPARTLRRWHRLYRAAEERYGFGILGLIPRYKDRGNYGAHFSGELLQLVDRIIETIYCTAVRPNRRHTYDQLRIECEQKGHIPPSYPWFTKRLGLRDNYSVKLSREGKRVAHRFELIRPGEPNDNHGAFPWDCCATDHTLTDLELRCSETGENLGRAWLSLLFDGFSRRVLSFVLTFDPPSYRTLMLLIRSCVERHHRLPRTLLVDGGREFQSVYFESLMAAYAVALKRRPPAKPRFGTIIERLFGTINSAFLHTLQGNTQNTRNIRGLVKSMNPKEHAVHTLEELHAMLSAFLFEHYDTRVHPSLNCSPAEKFEKGLELCGTRTHKEIVPDETFRLMTLPSTLKGTAKVQPGMGLKMTGFYYWAPEMRSRHFEGKSVKIKYDPQNLGACWAYLGDQWVQCRPNGTLNLDGRTEKEIQLATLVWRRSRRTLGQRQSNSHRELALFLKSAEAATALRIQQAKDRALRRIISKSTHSEPLGSSDLNSATNSTASECNDSPSPVISETPPSPMQDYGDF